MSLALIGQSAISVLRRPSTALSEGPVKFFQYLPKSTPKSFKAYPQNIGKKKKIKPKIKLEIDIAVIMIISASSSAAAVAAIAVVLMSAAAAAAAAGSSFSLSSSPSFPSFPPGKGPQGLLSPRSNNQDKRSDLSTRAFLQMLDSKNSRTRNPRWRASLRWRAIQSHTALPRRWWPGPPPVSLYLLDPQPQAGLRVDELELRPMPRPGRQG